MNNLKLTAAAILLGISGAFAQSVKDAQKLIEVEQYGKAGNMLKGLVAQTPSAENLYYLGDYYLKVEKPDSARIYFEKGLAADPQNPYNHVGMGTLQVINKNLEASKAHFNTALQLTKSKNVDVLYKVSEAYTVYDVNDAAEAATLLEKAAKLDKKRADIYSLMGDVYLLKNEGGKAADNYEKAISMNPNLAKPYFRMGKLFIRARNYNEALNKYKEGIDKEPNFWPGYRLLGELYFMAGRNEQALQNYRKYIENTDKSPDTQLKFANVLLTSKNYSEALEVLEQLKAVMAENPLIYRGLAYAQYETGKYDEAFKNMDILFAKIEPAKINANDYEYKGKLFMKTGSDSLALINLQKAAELDTLKAKVFKEAGDDRYKERQFQSAAKYYQAAVNANRNATGYEYFDLGKSHYFAKNYILADTAFSKMVELMPDVPTAYLWKARTSVTKDPDSKKGLAKPYYEKFVTLLADKDKYKKEDLDRYQKDIISAYSYLGYYYTLQKNKAKADESWNKVLEIDPNNEKAKKGLLIK